MMMPDRTTQAGMPNSAGHAAQIDSKLKRSGGAVDHRAVNASAGNVGRWIAVRAASLSTRLSILAAVLLRFAPQQLPEQILGPRRWAALENPALPIGNLLQVLDPLG